MSKTQWTGYVYVTPQIQTKSTILNITKDKIETISYSHHKPQPTAYKQE